MSRQHKPMAIQSYHLPLNGNGSQDFSVQEKYKYVTIYNLNSAYTVNVYLNGTLIYMIPASWSGSVPLGSLAMGGVSNTVTVQWTGTGAGFLPVIFTPCHISERQ